MKLSLLTWNSISINDGTNFNAYILPGQLANITSSPVTVNRASDYPYLSTVVKNTSQIIIGVTVAAGQNINTNRELLKQYFYSDELNRHNLIAQDENDSDTQYFRTGFPVRFIQEANDRPNSFFITLQTEYPYWQLVNPTSDSWDITASGDSDVITNSGNIPVPPVLTITPITTKTAGLKYRRYIPIYNNMDKTFSAPIDLTNGGLDVQTLINNNKMQADGDDFRAWINGSFADRWLYGIDSDSDPAKLWVNYELKPRLEGITSTTFDSDDTTLYFNRTKQNLTFLKKLKLAINRTLLIESEAVGFADSDVDLVAYSISNVTRAQKDTSEAGHTAPQTVRHIEQDTWLLYGDSDMTSQDVDDKQKPIFDLSSTNQIWSFTNYYSTLSNRPGMWHPEVLSSKSLLSYTFTGNENTFANPSTKLGLAMVNGGDFQVANEAGTLDWIFSHPCGITDVTYSGKVYNTGSWPTIVGLQYLQPNAVWFTAVDETEPAVASTWEAFGPHITDLAGTYETIRFVIDGQLDSVINEMAMVQFDTTSLTFDSDNLPTIQVNAENSINFFDFTLTNSTTGEFIKVQTPCKINTTLTIDCEKREAYLQDGTRVNVIFSSDREDWFNLKPGANSWNYVDVGTVAVNIVISHRDRIL